MAISTAAKITASTTGADSASGPRASPRSYPESFWRSLKQLNGFRLFLAVFFTATAAFSDRLHLLGSGNPHLLVLAALAYFGLALWFAHSLDARRIGFGRQLVSQLASDILVIALFVHSGGGIESGLGLILTVPLAAAGLHPNTRLRFAIAGAAGIAILGQQTLLIIAHGASTGSYLLAALLAVGFFTVTAISHILAKGSLNAADLAGEKAQHAQHLQRINSKVIQDLPNGVLVLDRDGGILLFNSQAERLIGGPLAPRARLDDCNPELATAWRNWQRLDGPNPVILSSAEPHRIRARLLELDPLRHEGGMVIVDDLSELEQEAMQMKLAALGRLTANLAHEIRNPLSAISHASQLLREDLGSDSAADKLTAIIEDNVKRLNYLVEDVLLLSRRDRLNREAIALHDFLPDFVAHVQRSDSLADGIIAVNAECQATVLFDRIHLHQILWNLSRNAVRHCSHTRGSIRLNVADGDELVHIDVYNDGPGIPPEMRQRLFEPFYSTDKRGTGLGLNIALELAEANEAQLRYIEQPLGALFRLSCKPAQT